MNDHSGHVKNHRAGRVVLVTLGSVVSLLTLGLGVVVTVGGVFVPAAYLQPWSETYSQAFVDPRMKVVSQAVLAPSGHNMQPWTIRLDQVDPKVLYLYADPTRLSPAVDPLARQALVSQGAFLGYAQVAAEHLGYTASLELFPGGTYDETGLEVSMSELPVAKITLSDRPSASTDDYDSMFLSDTNRSPYTSAPLTDAQATTLTDLADTSALATLSVFSDTKNMTTLGDLAIEGTLIETEYLPATEESNAVFHSTEQSKNEALSGFAVEGQGTSGFMKYLLQGLITIVPSINDDASAAANAIALTDAGVENTAAYAMISTPGNTRVEQVEAGILYARLSLHARTIGLVMQPLSQVLQEYPTMAAPYKAIHEQYAPDGATIQMLVRVGTPTREYPVTMRRDANSLVDTP
ncbi:Acg family FMN-binding oxidoreductase [Microbacterium sp. NPDC087665]|uniref:Acg family FMN-binding oxidoreductase n=1 Tax=Microbacterium sp. NPDC087665 TaxID=3364194 RepID=UPI003807AAEC